MNNKKAIVLMPQTIIKWVLGACVVIALFNIYSLGKTDKTFFLFVLIFLIVIFLIYFNFFIKKRKKKKW